MFGSKQNHQKKNNLRFYIVGITILIAAIFVFFFLNKENFSGATVAVDLVKDKFFNNNDNTDDATDNINSDEDDNVNNNNDANSNNNDNGNPSTGLASEDSENFLSLTFDQIPSINTETEVETLRISFSNPSTIIKINNDRLELDNLEEVELSIDHFFGDLALDKDSLSLDGTAKLVEVNKVVLSSKDELEISFQNLDYNTLNIENVELSALKLDVGDGELHLASKLSYVLREEDVNLDSFQGSLFLGKDVGTALRLEGIIDGLSISGEVFDLDLLKIS